MDVGAGGAHRGFQGQLCKMLGHKWCTIWGIECTGLQMYSMHFSEHSGCSQYMGAASTFEDIGYTEVIQHALGWDELG